MLNFKAIFIALIATFMLAGCASRYCGSCGTAGADIDGQSKMYFEEVMRVPADCSACEGSGDGVFINGVKYKSDVAINCCLEKNMIDINIGLKKVYLHRIVDARENARSIYYTKKDGSGMVFSSNPRLEVLLYLFLEKELSSRGMVVVDTQTSPYTYRLDFSFDYLRGNYNQNGETLNGRLNGRLHLSNINFNKQINIATRHHVEKLEADRSDQFDFFIALLVKQAAIKIADEISKL